jgi:2-aminoadipate transaminase
MATHFPQETGVIWTSPEGGLFLWVTVPQSIDTRQLFYKAIEHKVAFVPGDAFYGENPALNHMRINFSYASREQLVEAVKRLAGCMKAVL